MDRIRLLAIKIARKYYRIYLIIRWIYRTEKFLRVLCEVKIRSAIFRKKVSRGLTIIHIDPTEISNYTDIDTCKFSDVGIVRDGLWDLDGQDIKGDVYYDSIRDLVNGTKKWSETGLYKQLRERWTRGEIAQGIRTKDDLEGMGEKIILLYEDIKIKGFKSQRQLQSNYEHPLLLQDDVAINIGRNGKYLLVDGLHRVVIAQLLKLNAIPVRVCIRHKEWDDFREKIRAFANLHGGSIYQQLLHPDMRDIPAFHSDERMGIICPHLPCAPATVLDMGANWGYFCQVLEEKSYICTAVENDPEHLYFLKRFRQVRGRNFKIIAESIFDLRGTLDFDVVLALNLFHHFLRFKESHDRLVHFLRKLKTRIMFFQPHLEREFCNDTPYRNYSPEEFAEFVKTHMGLHRVERIGMAPDGRYLFKIS